MYMIPFTNYSRCNLSSVQKNVDVYANLQLVPLDLEVKKKIGKILKFLIISDEQFIIVHMRIFIFRFTKLWLIVEGIQYIA